MYCLLPCDATQSTVMRLHVVCPSVTLRYDFHTGWNTLKIIAQLNSVGSLLSLTPIWAVLCNGNTHKIGVEYGWGQKKLIKAPIFLASLPMKPTYHEFEFMI